MTPEAAGKSYPSVPLRSPHRSDADNNRHPADDGVMSRIIAVTSGKGGVGKTHLSVNLALQCARAGLRTCVFDADLGLANANLLLKLTPQRTLADVLAGRCTTEDIVQTAFDIDVIPGSSGVEHMADLAPAAFARLDGVASALRKYDVIFVDTASGVADNVLAFVAAAPEVLLVITPEPTALTDAYAVVKLLQRRSYRGHIRVVVNQAASKRQALHTYDKFREVVRVYQGLDVPLLGFVPADPHVVEAVRAQLPVSILRADAPAALAFGELAAAVLAGPMPPAGDNGLDLFWERLTGRPPAPAGTTAAPIGHKRAAQPEFLVDRLGRPETRAAELAETTAENARAQTDAAQASVESTRPSHNSSQPLRSEVEPATPVPDVAPQRRRSREMAGGGRGLRANSRATPIDALQLRRVVGRMLVKAMPAAGTDGAGRDQPVHIAVDQLQLEADNEFSLRPGRYTRMSLQCAHIESPDRFIEEIFANCAITGCKVRHLGSHVRYWVTGGRDGCILLDGAVGERDCVQVYMAAAGNSPLESFDPAPDRSIPTLRRVGRADAEEAAPARLLGKFPHERLDGADGTMFRLARRDREPLLCAFHRAAADEASAAVRDRSL